MNLAELKASWNEILDELENGDRIAWLTFFDARLANLSGDQLELDFADPEKFDGKHDYTDARSKFAPLLMAAIEKITGERIEVIW